jgi:hypothetical protein
MRHTFQSTDNTRRRFDSTTTAGRDRHATTRYPHLVSLHDSSRPVASRNSGSEIPLDREEGRCECGVLRVGYSPGRICTSPRLSNLIDDMRLFYFLQKIPIVAVKRDFPLSPNFGAFPFVYPTFRLPIAIDFMLVELQQLCHITGNRLPQSRIVLRYSFPAANMAWHARCLARHILNS